MTNGMTNGMTSSQKKTVSTDIKKGAGKADKKKGTQPSSLPRDSNNIPASEGEFVSDVDLSIDLKIPNKPSKHDLPHAFHKEVELLKEYFNSKFDEFKHVIKEQKNTISKLQQDVVELKSEVSDLKKGYNFMG